MEAGFGFLIKRLRLGQIERISETIRAVQKFLGALSARAGCDKNRAAATRDDLFNGPGKTPSTFLVPFDLKRE
jgi:hypothetical protein